MYKLHLILKYLRKRRIAWVSLVAVMLCTAMVLVVLSVMGGWLRMFKQSFHGMSGDLIVSRQTLAGFPHYAEMIARIEQLPGVEAAVPTIRTFGLIDLGRSAGGKPITLKRRGVQVVGLPIDRIGRVNNFPETLYRQHERPLQEGKTPPAPSFSLLPDVPYETILPNAKNVRRWPGMIAGAGVVEVRKDANGDVKRPDILYELWAKLTVVGISAQQRSLDIGSQSTETFWIVDDSRSQLWQYDSDTVYVPFDVLQKNLGMEAFEGEPARASEIHIKIKDNADRALIKAEVQDIINKVIADRGIDYGPAIEAQTWEESQALWIGAIEKETALVTVLFAMISVVAIFLIFCIFYMIVVEKTRDIGIVKSVGATSAGVAGIFLGYGLAIGIVGGFLGFGLGYLVVHNINQLHTWMGKVMGIQIWNPEIYAFDTIPNTVNPVHATVIVAVAIVASVLGAVIPAMRAARLNPVESLRWE